MNDAFATSTEISHACVGPRPCRCKAHRRVKNTARSLGGVFHDIGDTGSTGHSRRTRRWTTVGGYEGSVERCQNNASVDRTSPASWHNCQKILLDLDSTKTEPPNAVPVDRWDPCWQ